MGELQSQDPLVWIDCEMTGLDSRHDTILEVACFVTDASLNLLDSHGYEARITHTKAQLDAMDEWCTTHHGSSGLSAACLDLNTSKPAEQVAQELLGYIQRFVPQSRKGVLAGNSVHADKAFLVQGPWNPIVEWLHYRLLDVSAIKEAARRWAPVGKLEGVPAKTYRHTAREDILESIAEARYYQKVFFET